MPVTIQHSVQAASLLVLSVSRVLSPSDSRRDGSIRVVIIPMALQGTTVIRKAIRGVAKSDGGVSILRNDTCIEVHQALSRNSRYVRSHSMCGMADRAGEAVVNVPRMRIESPACVPSNTGRG